MKITNKYKKELTWNWWKHKHATSVLNKTLRKRINEFLKKYL